MGALYMRKRIANGHVIKKTQSKLRLAEYQKQKNGGGTYEEKSNK